MGRSLQIGCAEDEQVEEVQVVVVVSSSTLSYKSSSDMVHINVLIKNVLIVTEWNGRHPDAMCPSHEFVKSRKKNNLNGHVGARSTCSDISKNGKP